MALELQDTLNRIAGKCDILIEKYRLLLSEKDELEVQIEVLNEELTKQRGTIQKLQQENDYLKLARSIVPDSTQAQQARKTISKLMQDIDKCIAQLNE